MFGRKKIYKVTNILVHYREIFRKKKKKFIYNILTALVSFIICLRLFICCLRYRFSINTRGWSRVLKPKSWYWSNSSVCVSILHSAGARPGISPPSCVWIRADRTLCVPYKAAHSHPLQTLTSFRQTACRGERKNDIAPCTNSAYSESISPNTYSSELSWPSYMEYNFSRSTGWVLITKPTGENNP